MSGETTITIVGNLTADPELRFTPSGAAVANFTVASTPRKFDKQANEWKDGETLFMRCSGWRDMAENIAESLQRGMRVVVQGRLTSRSYETKEGEKRTSVELDIEEVGPSLRYASAKVTKAERTQGQQGGQQQGQWGGQQQQPAYDPWATPPQQPQQHQPIGTSNAPSSPQSPGPQQGQGWGPTPGYDEPPF